MISQTFPLIIQLHFQAQGLGIQSFSIQISLYPCMAFSFFSFPFLIFETGQLSVADCSNRKQEINLRSMHLYSIKYVIMFLDACFYGHKGLQRPGCVSQSANQQSLIVCLAGALQKCSFPRSISIEKRGLGFLNLYKKILYKKCFR